MENWDEVRTAYFVAKLGTISAAAEQLGVHHATVIRHVSTLETRLGVKLFQRHARGYTATEAGEDLCRVGQVADEQFSQLSGRLKGKGEEVSGELVVTSLNGIAPMMTSALTAFQAEHPDIVVRYLTGDRLFRLEYGEAHVAIRAGAAPEQPDNVVQPFVDIPVGLYAAKSYVERFGKPENLAAYAEHRFVGADADPSRVPYFKWLSAHVPRENVVFRSADSRSLKYAVIAGAGIGFLTAHDAALLPEIVEISPPRSDWSAPLWLVTHVDLHRTTKVQAFTTFLKNHAKTWTEL